MGLKVGSDVLVSEIGRQWSRVMTVMMMMKVKFLQVQQQSEQNMIL